ncbi:MAG TPA: glycosyltransferase, partial [Phycisphaerae bacterium]|nr:glycosyltransferase [Phycisphaerae bacterium]
GELAHLQALVGRLQLGQDVRFAGPLYGQEKLAAYVDADVVASPGAYEIFGLVPFEALMCGTPVVVGDGSGVSELIREAGAGYVVAPGDVAALADKLRRDLTSGVEAQAQVASGQAFVRRELAWNAISGHLEDLYAGIT